MDDVETEDLWTVLGLALLTGGPVSCDPHLADALGAVEGALTTDAVIASAPGFWVGDKADRDHADDNGEAP